jgi:hypothetical protein
MVKVSAGPGPEKSEEDTTEVEDSVAPQKIKKIDDDAE